MPASNAVIITPVFIIIVTLKPNIIKMRPGSPSNNKNQHNHWSQDCHRFYQNTYASVAVWIFVVRQRLDDYRRPAWTIYNVLS